MPLFTFPNPVNAIGVVESENSGFTISIWNNNNGGPFSVLEEGLIKRGQCVMQFVN